MTDTPPTDQEIEACLRFIAANANANRLPIEAYQVVGQLRGWFAEAQADREDQIFRKWLAGAFPWLSQESPDARNLRAAWDAGAQAVMERRE